ncbi:hypothetical protein SFMTTN_2974 [Sulfuriferula multivorans]|uniref:Uncharacterized protein n=1 Tax=Sulfuriferula multivorans TaxID=1559896 RepID=A0A401K0J4_9PROT|nr:hypothetical protein SFMTTN_2974 [Sulfuriferula multivorans]
MDTELNVQDNNGTSLNEGADSHCTTRHQIADVLQSTCICRGRRR